MNDRARPASAGSSRSSTGCGSIFPHRFDLRNDAGDVALVCCKVGLDRSLIPTAFVANLFRSARVSRSWPNRPSRSLVQEPMGSRWGLTPEPIPC